MDIESKIFEKLYKYDKNGNIKEWAIWVINKGHYSTLNINYGVMDSKKVECVREISKGKNLNKKNSTTHYEQALLEAESKWKNKQEKENYQIRLNLNIDKKINPMLAYNFEDHENKIQYPCFIQPKFDGYRMIFNGEKCLTRQGKEYEILYTTQLFKELQILFNDFKIILDGELYLHDSNFENLGIVRKKKLTNEMEKEFLNKIEYHVYDIVEKYSDFEHRILKLQNCIMTNFKMIKISPTFMIKDNNEITTFHNNFINQGFEGSILRNLKGCYEEGRSFNLQKYKYFKDDEFKIVDFTKEIDRLSQKELIIWTCKTNDGKIFNVRPSGQSAEKHEIYKKCVENFIYKDKLLWVKYFNLTKNGVPRFPTTKTCDVNSYIRDETV